MSEHFMNRNGVVEQVRYYRRQPEYMKHVPWAWEVKQKRAVFIETMVVLTVLSISVGLFVWVYLIK